MRSREKAYEILSIRDFGKPAKKCQGPDVWSYDIQRSTEKDSCNHMARNGQDVEEFTSVFFLPGMDPRSVVQGSGGMYEC